MSINCLIEALAFALCRRISRSPICDDAEYTDGVRLGMTFEGTPRAARPVGLTTSDLARHSYLVGSSGSGKTTVILPLYDWMIVNGRSVIVIDLRGDLVNRCLIRLAALYQRELAEAVTDSSSTASRIIDRLAFIDLRQDDYICPANLLAGRGSPHSRALHVMRVLKEHAESWGVQIEQTMLCCLLALAEFGGTIGLIEDLLCNAAFRVEVLSRVTDPAVRSFFERYEQLSEEKKESWRQPCLNKLAGFLSASQLRLMFSAPEASPLRKALDTPGSITLISLSVDTLYESAHTAGGLLVSEIESAIMARVDVPEGSRNPVVLVVDEFEALARHNFETMLAEGRRFGLTLLLAHQTLAQLPRDLKEIILANAATQVFLQMSATDAQELARSVVSKVPKAKLRDELMSQPVGNGFLVRRAQEPLKVKFDYVPDPKVPAAIVAELRDHALKRFGIPRPELEAQIKKSKEGTVSPIKRQRRIKHESKPGPL